MPLSNATFPEVLEVTGLSPDIFDLTDPTLFDEYLERQLPFATADVRRGVGDAVYETTDADRCLQVRSAEIYRLAARILRTIRIQMSLGLGPPLLVADMNVIKELEGDLVSEAESAMDLARLEAPTGTGDYVLARHTNENSENTHVTTPKWSRGMEW